MAVTRMHGHLLIETVMVVGVIGAVLPLVLSGYVGAVQSFHRVGAGYDRMMAGASAVGRNVGSAPVKAGVPLALCKEESVGFLYACQP